MKVIRHKAVQVHPVPSTVYRPQGIFDPGVVAQPVIDYDLHEDEFPMGATATNGMKGVPLYRCNHCDGVVAESEMKAHIC
jgi:hypothetical protein